MLTLTSARIQRFFPLQWWFCLSKKARNVEENEVISNLPVIRHRQCNVISSPALFISAHSPSTWIIAWWSLPPWRRRRLSDRRLSSWCSLSVRSLLSHCDWRVLAEWCPGSTSLTLSSPLHTVTDYVTSCHSDQLTASPGRDRLETAQTGLDNAGCPLPPLSSTRQHTNNTVAITQATLAHFTSLHISNTWGRCKHQRVLFLETQYVSHLPSWTPSDLVLQVTITAGVGTEANKTCGQPRDISSTLGHRGQLCPGHLQYTGT